MSQNPYQVFGPGTPRMLGRDSLYRDLCRRLDKPTPDNVSLVGPRSYGKTVILRHLVSDYERGKKEHAEFVGAFYWDLSSQPPTSDTAFMKRLCQLTKDVLKRAGLEAAEYIETGEAGFDGLLESLKYAYSELQERDIWLLGVIDGLERSLIEEGLSRNLWGNLRYLASETSLRLVTGSCRPISELCMTEGAKDSHFHLIFNTAPITVGRFGEQELDGVLAPLAEKAASVADSARKELFQWTGGVPLLAAAVLEEVYAQHGAEETIGQPHITQFAEKVTDSRRDILKMLFTDCSPEMQSDLVDLHHREIKKSEVSPDRLEEHDVRGFASASGGVLKSRSRMMDDFARRQSSGLPDLKRLFGDDERFSQNIRPLLELRLHQVGQLRGVDADLFNIITKALRDIHDPADAIAWARRIANRAFVIVWQSELPGGEIPLEWLPSLRDAGRDRRIPAGGAACRLLQLATGTDSTPRLTQFVTKRTYALVNFMQSVGDHGQHLKDEDVIWSYAASFCFAAIELLESLALDLTP